MHARLSGFLDHAVTDGFIRPEYPEMLIVRDDADALLDALGAYEPPKVAKWIGAADT